MKFKWWGHASFLISTAEGFKIITDPYNEDLPYAQIDDSADIVTVSHGHFDHNSVELLSGDPRVVDKVDGFSDENIEIILIK
ncbi:MAG: MBL fold metallo-hydrolase [Halanaerobiaceae bacterium]